MMTSNVNKISIDCGNNSIPVVIHEPAGNAFKNIILSHGIFSDKDESGRFIRLAKMLSDMGCRVIRYDFRGHGENSMPLENISIGGMIVDFDTVIRFVKATFPGDISWVCSSFGGAVSLLYLTMDICITPSRFVLLNPVVDFHKTFLVPEGSDMDKLFGNGRWQEAIQMGIFEPIPGKLIGMQLLVDLMLLKPYEGYKSISFRTLVMHGDADNSVPYIPTLEHGRRNKQVKTIIVKGADHAFDQPWEEEITFRNIKQFFDAE